MDKDITVGKLKLNVEEYHIPFRTALEYAYAAGYDQRGKELTAHNKKAIVQYNRYGEKLNEFNSIDEAARVNKFNRMVIDEILSGKHKCTRKNGYYFKYADNETRED